MFTLTQGIFLTHIQGGEAKDADSVDAWRRSGGRDLAAPLHACKDSEEIVEMSISPAAAAVVASPEEGGRSSLAVARASWTFESEEGWGGGDAERVWKSRRGQRICRLCPCACACIRDDHPCACVRYLLCLCANACASGACVQHVETHCGLMCACHACTHASVIITRTH